MNSQILQLYCLLSPITGMFPAIKVLFRSLGISRGQFYKLERWAFFTIVLSNYAIHQLQLFCFDKLLESCVFDKMLKLQVLRTQPQVNFCINFQVKKRARPSPSRQASQSNILWIFISCLISPGQWTSQEITLQSRYNNKHHFWGLHSFLKLEPKILQIY